VPFSNDYCGFQTGLFTWNKKTSLLRLGHRLPLKSYCGLNLTKKFVNQAHRLDDIAKLLIMVELAVPGLYATALKLIEGDKASLAVTPAVYTTFFFWFAALALTLVALLPKSYQVDRSTYHGTPPSDNMSPGTNTQLLSIEDYSKKTTHYINTTASSPPASVFLWA